MMMHSQADSPHALFKHVGPAEARGTLHQRLLHAGGVEESPPHGLGDHGGQQAHRPGHDRARHRRAAQALAT